MPDNEEMTDNEKTAKVTQTALESDETEEDYDYESSWKNYF